jgi:hypothetical protein
MQYCDQHASLFVRPWEGGDVYVNVTSLTANGIYELKDGTGNVVKEQNLPTRPAVPQQPQLHLFIAVDTCPGRHCQRKREISTRRKAVVS